MCEMKTTKFKMTELGPIPKDWEVKRLGDVVETSSGGTPSRARPDFFQGTIKWFTTTELLDNKLYDSLEHISHEALKNSSAKIFPPKTLLMAMYGATIGRLGILQNHASTNQACCAIFCGDTLFSDYAYYYLYHLRQNIIERGCGAGQPNISQEIVRSLPVVLPPLPEQRKIAEALSDIDELISALGKLIEKKRNIKTGAIQELLGMRNEECGMRNVPRRRLAGFSGEWVEKRLGDYAIVARGGSPRPIEAFLTSHNDGLNWVKIGDVGVGAKYIERTAEKILPSGLSSTRMVYPGDFLLSNSMSFGRPYIMKITGCIHDGWLVIQDYKTTFDTEYLYYVLGSEMVVNQYRVLAAGSSVLNLNKDVVASVTVVVPPTLAEQKAIAAVLSDMDAEIEALEAKRAKYESIKQGMMQELLTGRTRLI